MIRFIIGREIRDSGDVRSPLETFDVDVPGLEKILTRGGYGGGPDNENYDYSNLIGAEVRRPS